MTKSWRVALLLCTVISWPAAFGGSDEDFEIFKGLEGRWSIQSNGKTLSIEMTYTIGSKGSIVMEQFGKELSVIYRDGGSLMMTHYCNAGNEPRLRLQPNSSRGTYQFEMFDITNLKSADTAHVQKVIYKIIDARKMDLEIVWQEGKSSESEKYTLTKI